MNLWGPTLASVSAVSLVSLLGVFTLAIRRKYLDRILMLFVSFAVGALFGDAFIHLIPEAILAQARIGSEFKVSALILLGILIFFVMEKGIRWRNSHAPDRGNKAKPFVAIILVGDTFHNFIDGMVIAASYSISFHLGLTTTVAVLMHEIPHEIGDFSALLHGGLSARKALIYNFLSAVTAIIGAVVALAVGRLAEGFSVALVPVTAGGFIYLAGSDLLPELYSENGVVQSVLQLTFMLVGILMMAALMLTG